MFRKALELTKVVITMPAAEEQTKRHFIRRNGSRVVSLPRTEQTQGGAPSTQFWCGFIFVCTASLIAIIPRAGVVGNYDVVGPRITDLLAR